MRSSRDTKLIVSDYKELIDKKEMKEIIRDNINVQVYLASIYIFRKEGIPPEVKLNVKVGFLSDDINQEIEMFKKVFDRLLLTEFIDGDHYCTVTQMNPRTMDIFLELKEEGQINKWLEYFTLREFQRDCSHFIYAKLEYQADRNTQVMDIMKKVEEMESDPFFQYFLDTHKNCFGEKIMISGFTLQEIFRDENIFAFSQLVNPLYVEIIDGRKFLSFNESVF